MTEPFYVKVHCEHITGCGKLSTCDCEIIKVKWPVATIKVCSTHQIGIKEGTIKELPYTSPWVCPKKF